MHKDVSKYLNTSKSITILKHVSGWYTNCNSYQTTEMYRPIFRCIKHIVCDRDKHMFPLCNLFSLHQDVPHGLNVLVAIISVVPS